MRDAVDDVARAFERLAAIGRGGDPRRQPVDLDHPLEDAAGSSKGCAR